MFNRAIKLKVVKTEKKVATPVNDIPVEAKYALVANLVSSGIEKIGKAAICYVLVDTLRQVAIAKASNK